MSTICKIYFESLLTFSISFFILSLDFMILDYKLIIEWEVLSLNSSPIYMVILLDWMFVLFMSFVLFISCMVIFYSEGYMEGDFNIYYYSLFICVINNAFNH